MTSIYVVKKTYSAESYMGTATQYRGHVRCDECSSAVANGTGGMFSGRLSLATFATQAASKTRQAPFPTGMSHCFFRLCGRFLHRKGPFCLLPEFAFLRGRKNQPSVDFLLLPELRNRNKLLSKGARLSNSAKSEDHAPVVDLRIRFCGKSWRTAPESQANRSLRCVYC